MDLSEFNKLESASIAKGVYRRRAHVPVQHTYVCTICGQVRMPTTDRNLRCGRCEAPLGASMETVYALQNRISANKFNPIAVEQLVKILRRVKRMNKEFIALVPNSRRPPKPRMEASIKVKRMGKMMVFQVYIPPGKKADFMQGGNVEIEVPTNNPAALKKLQSEVEKIGGGMKYLETCD